ncbi:hypothetical protein QBC46DRAFT_273516, partial [Diplogelasinospora grovesii]
AWQFKVPVGYLRRRMKGIKTKKDVIATNTKLSRPEEAALCRYIDRLDAINLHIQREMIHNTTNLILKVKLTLKLCLTYPYQLPRFMTYTNLHNYHYRRDP